MQPQLRYRMEYGAVRILSGMLNVLPYRVALVVACGFAKLVFTLMKKRRKEAQRRIRLVMGETMSAREIQRISWVSFRNTVFNVVEMMRVKHFNLNDLNHLMPEVPALIEQLRTVKQQSEGRGMILALPHMGNWDLTGSACYLSGLPIFSIAGKQRNTLMNDWINRQRSGHGMAIIERGSGTLRQILTRIKGGEIFAILPDTRSFKADLPIPFLGGVANLARGMASFAISANVPVVPTLIRRRGWSHFQINLHDPIWPNPEAKKQDELERITREVMVIIDAAIRETPEQWFWYNKRWVLDPVGE